MTKKIFALLFLITFLGGLLRFRDITTNPAGINTDEAAIGYNAYSLLKTGRDEYGQWWPLAFRSFDDYKPPLYVYLTVPSVAIFGLNEFSVRFPSAFLGTLAIVITFFLTKKLFDNTTTALAAAFFLAISPWHIQFTRTAYETGSNAFFTSIGLWFFLKGLEEKRFWIASGIIFGLQTHLYQATKIFVPLLLALVFVAYWRRWVQKYLHFGYFVLPFLVVFLPVVIIATSPTGILRLQGTSVFQDPKSADRQVGYEIADWLRNDNKSVMVFHPKMMIYFQDILVGYLSHFRPDFLLASRSDPKVAYVPEVGLVQPWVFFFFLAGVYYLFRRSNKTATVLLIGWILIAPIPASVTTGLPSSIRTAVFLPSLQIVAAFGLVNFYRMLRRAYPKILPAIVLLNVLMAMYLFAFYAHMLFLHAPTFYARQWYSGYKSLVLDSASKAGSYDKVIVTSLLDQPQIFYLFYLRYDPVTYLSEGGTVGGGFSQQGNRLANKFYFHTIDWFAVRQTPRILLVADAREIPVEAREQIIGKYYSADGQILAYLLATR